MQVHLDALDDFGRDAAAKLAVFGLVGLGRGARGARRARTRPRRCASSPRPRSSSSRPTSRFAGTREFAFKHALMREVAYASLGEDAAARVPRARRAVAREDGRGRRDRRASPRARRATKPRPRSYLEKAARRALAAHALAGGGDARREGARVRRGQADAVRARAAPRRSVEPPRRARGRARHRRSRDGGGRPRQGERGARRAARACATKTRAAATPTRARGSTRCASRRSRPSSPTKRRAARRRSRRATRTRASSTRRSEVADELLTLAQQHNIAGAAVDAWQTLAVVRQTRGEVGAALEARRSAARAASAAGLKTREATLTINVGLRAHDGRRTRRGAARDRERHRARPGDRLARAWSGTAR